MVELVHHFTWHCILREYHKLISIHAKRHQKVFFCACVCVVNFLTTQALCYPLINYILPTFYDTNHFEEIKCLSPTAYPDTYENMISRMGEIEKTLATVKETLSTASG